MNRMEYMLRLEMKLYDQAMDAACHAMNIPCPFHY